MCVAHKRVLFLSLSDGSLGDFEHLQQSVTNNVERNGWVGVLDGVLNNAISILISLFWLHLVRVGLP